MKRWAVAVVGMGLCCVAAVAQGQRVETPEAREFGVWVDDAEHLMVGIVEIVPGTDEGVGFTVRCVRRGRHSGGNAGVRLVPARPTRPGGG